MWVGGGVFSKAVVSLNHVGGSSNLCKYHHQECLNNSMFSNLGLCAACWTCFMCHHELWPTWVSHPFSIATEVLLEENITRKLLSLSLDMFFKILFSQVPYTHSVLFLPFVDFSLPSSGWVVIAACGSISVQCYFNFSRNIVNWCRVTISNDKQLNVCPHLLPKPVLAFGYCCCLRLSVCVCVCLCFCQPWACLHHNSSHHLFKRGSSNLDQTCRTP